MASRSIVALIAASTAIAFGHPVSAQFGPVNGMRPADLRTHAIVDATVIPSPGERLERATILIRDGVIVAVGPDVRVPPGAWVWPAEGLTVYSGLIESALMISPAERPSGPGAHWNGMVTPEISMSEQPAPPANVRKQLRDLGFTTAAVYPSSGVMRGSGTVIALAEETEHVLAYREKAAMAAGFDTGRRGAGTGYPGSLMGAIALARQTFYDAQWHAACRRIYEENGGEGLEPPIRADALAALDDVINRRQRVLFDVSDELNALRAAKIAEEFDLDVMLLGSGFEFRRLPEIAALNMPIIVPLRYPERPNVNTLATAERTSVRDMQTWEQAPTNARRLVNEGVTVALTTNNLRRRGDFPRHLRTAIEHGLSEDDALAALTTTPAKLLGLERTLGTIEPGKAANLVVVKGGLFDNDAKVRDVWINGRRFEITKEPDIVFAGKGRLTTDRGDDLGIDIDTVRSRVSVEPPEGRAVRARNVTVQRDQVSFIIDGGPFNVDGFVRLSGAITRGAITGVGVTPDGSEFRFTIEIDEPRAPDEGQEDKPEDDKAEDDKAEDAGAEEEDDGISGRWHLTVNVDFEGVSQSIPVTLTLNRHEDGSISGTSSAMGTSMDISNASYTPATGELRYEIDTPGGLVAVRGTVEGDRFTGASTGVGLETTFSGTREPRAEGVAAADELPFEMPPDDLVFPLGEYGVREMPQREDLLIVNATIWTSGPDGIIENGWMEVRDGRIAGIGGGDPPAHVQARANPNPTMRVVDAGKRHITPGLIDCHSHTGISGGVNEFSHVNTAEVRIADVINPDDINWYRQLAGGLTAANQLHGSANPIGGQNSVVKLKWGGTADDFLIDDAIPGIKFALGENVVRSTTRYPNTRMGVETVLRDAFTAAREYAIEWERWSNTRNGYPPRRDLVLDALVEILNDERLVHCHSYRQDEILMLVRVAEEFGFTIGTLQHVLEGYKVAEAIASHGAGASAFSDWWAYKVEVMDAIPHAGAIMHDVGVNVSFNSDSSELARRMNTEAAKAVRYGGVAPDEALKFVTINPAWQLRIDHRTGSLEPGKDADFVIWSGDPLSTYTRCEQTWIEGAMYFCIERDRTLREEVERERQRLIQKVLRQAHGASRQEGREAERPQEGERPERPRGRRPRLIETAMDIHRQRLEEMVRMGIDPDEIRPGECGCNDWWYGLR